MDVKALLDKLGLTLGQVGVDALSAKLDELAANQNEPWKMATLALLADAVEEQGMAGVNLARQALDALIKNDVPNIDFASPRTASDFVAVLQNAEAGDKVAARDFLVKVGDTLSQVFVGIIKGITA